MRQLESGWQDWAEATRPPRCHPLDLCLPPDDAPDLWGLTDKTLVFPLKAGGAERTGVPGI